MILRKRFLQIGLIFHFLYTIKLKVHVGNY